MGDQRTALRDAFGQLVQTLHDAHEASRWRGGSWTALQKLLGHAVAMLRTEYFPTLPLSPQRRILAPGRGWPHELQTASGGIGTQS